MVNLRFGVVFAVLVYGLTNDLFAIGPFINLKADKHVRIATFHSLWVFTGFPERTLQRNRNHLSRIVRSFNDDFRELAPEAPSNLQIVAAPPIEMLVQAQNLSRVRLQEALRELERQVTPDGILFVYMMIHGNEGPAGIKLQCSDGELDRVKLVNYIERIRVARRARLAVVVTDNCSEASDEGKEVVPGAGMEASIWRALYFGHHGLVDLNSTGSGEFGFVVDGISVFNQAFRLALNLESMPATKALIQPRVGDTLATRRAREEQAKDLFVQLLDNTPRDGVVSWKEFERHLKDQMKVVFDASRDSIKESDSAMFAKMDTQKGQSLRLFHAGVVGQPESPPLQNR